MTDSRLSFAKRLAGNNLDSDLLEWHVNDNDKAFSSSCINYKMKFYSFVRTSPD